MTGPRTNKQELPIDQLVQLLQSDDDSPQIKKILANLSEEQLAELSELQAAVKMLEAFSPGQEASIDTATVQDQPTPGENGVQLESTFATDTIGPYEVLETIGQGGFGVVVKARDRRLGRLVALKIPRPESVVAGSNGRGRFAREARLVAMLGHPAIVPVYETGSDGQILYIASAFCNGGTLGQWLRGQDRKIAPRLATQIVARLSEAIQHAHVRGVIHRDLKPGNVLLHFDQQDLETRGDQAVVRALRVADFGLAKFAAANQTMTQSGATIGTPAYMSPEQARGAINEIGVGSDIYALGAILYELLTGQLPILGESNVATMRAIETKIPPSPQKLNPAVPPDLASICLKCLEKRSADRYPNAQELHDDLLNFLDGRPVQARPVSKLTHFYRWYQRNPLVAALLLLLFVTLLTGLSLTTWQWRNAQANLLESNRQSNRAVGHLQRAEDAIDDMLTDAANSLRNIPQMTPLRERLLLRALELQKGILAEEKDQLASLRTAHAHRRIGEIQTELGKPSEAAAQFGEALEVLDQLVTEGQGQPEWLVEQARLHRLTGHARYEMESAEAIESAEAAIALLDAATAIQPTLDTRIELSCAYRLLGMCRQRGRKAEQAVEAFQRAVDLLVDFEQSDDGHRVGNALSRAHNSLAIGQRAIGRHDKAIENYKASIRVTASALELDPGNVAQQVYMATTALNLGNFLFGIKHYETALENYELSVQTFEQLANDYSSVPRYLSLASMSNNGAGIALRRIDPPKAEESVKRFRRAIEWLRKKQGRFELTPVDRNELGTQYGNLGSVLTHELGLWDQGRKCLRESIDVLSNLVEEFPDRASYWKSLSLSKGNLASKMVAHGESLGDARDLFLEAWDAGLRAWQANPQNPAYRSNLEWQTRELAETNVKLGQVEETCNLAHRWVDLAPDVADHYQFSIQLLAKLINEVEQAPELDEQHRQRLQKQLADCAFDLIVIAKKRGYLTTSELKASEVLAPLRGRKRYQSVVDK